MLLPYKLCTLYETELHMHAALHSLHSLPCFIEAILKQGSWLWWPRGVNACYSALEPLITALEFPDLASQLLGIRAGLLFDRRDLVSMFGSG
jgi:hypothetical protein